MLLHRQTVIGINLELHSEQKVNSSSIPKIRLYKYTILVCYVYIYNMWYKKEQTTEKLICTIEAS